MSSSASMLGRSAVLSSMPRTRGQPRPGGVFPTETPSSALTPAGLLRVGVLGSEADPRSLTWPGTPRSDLVQRQPPCYRGEQLPYVLGRLGRRLEEQEPGLLRVRLGLGGRDYPLVGLLGDQVELVAGEGDDDVLVGLALQLLDPRLRLVERRLDLGSAPSRSPTGVRAGSYRLRDIVNDDGAVGVPVVHGRQRLVALLARRVPDLKLDRGVLVERYRLCQEGGADGGFSIGVELVL